MPRAQLSAAEELGALPPEARLAPNDVFILNEDLAPAIVDAPAHLDPCGTTHAHPGGWNALSGGNPALVRPPAGGHAERR